MSRILLSLLLTAMTCLLSMPATAWAEGQLVRETRLLAEQGDPEAQFSLGLLYDTGGQLEHDPEKAARWFAKAARQGVAGACLYLGMKYEFGSGVRQDREQAIFWYRQAALKGWGQAASMLGSLYLNLNTPETVKGCAWLCIAAARDFPGAEEAFALHCRPEKPLLRKEIKTLCSRLEQCIGQGLKGCEKK